MITTVTTTTTTTVAAASLASSLTFITIVALLAFLINKEILLASDHKWAKAISQVLNVAIVPLIFSAAFIILVKVAGVIG